MDARRHDSRSTPRAGGERGSALVIALLMVLAVAVLGVSYLGVSLSDRKIASNEANSAAALACADAGIEDARAVLPSATIDTLLTGGGNLFTNTALGAGTYSVVVSNNTVATPLLAADPGGANDDTDRIVVLTSTGRVKTATRVIRVVVTVPAPAGGGSFPYAAWANSKLTISGGAGLITGDVFANGVINPSGGAGIIGNATTATSPGPCCVSGGTVTANAPSQSIAAVSCPGSYTPAGNVPSGAGITYDAGAGKLTVSGVNLTLTSPPASFYFSELTLSGGGTLTINSGSHVDIYVTKKMTASGGGVVNTSGDANMLTFWACGGTTDAWTLSGGSNAYFAVHAPTRKVTVSGTGTVNGAIIGGEITLSGGSKLNYAMTSGGSSGSVATVVQRTWRELFQ